MFCKKLLVFGKTRNRGENYIPINESHRKLVVVVESLLIGPLTLDLTRHFYKLNNGQIVRQSTIDGAQGDFS